MIGLGQIGLSQGIKDTVVQMKTIPIERNASITSITVTHSEENHLDADYQAGKRVSDVLGENTSVFIKNYGVGQLSSISINGSSAAQTSIYWNGIKINSPTTGQVDLSLFDLGTIDEMVVANTTASNQSVGGGLGLQNNPYYSSDTLISKNVIRYGSFNTMNLSSNNVYDVGIFSGSTKVNYLRSDNDFPFVNYTQIGAPVQRQTNAATSLLSFLQQLDLKLKSYKDGKINAGLIFWVTDADRQISPVMTEPSSSAHEWDKSYRTLAYMKIRKANYTAGLKSSYLYDWLRFTDPVAIIDSRSSSQAVRNYFYGSYSKSHLFINGSFNYDHEQAVSSGFNICRNRNVEGLNLSVTKLFLQHLLVYLNLKQELLEHKPLPFSPGLWLGYDKFLKHGNIYLKLSGARAYRIPSLNDLYWNPGGNPNLQPEQAWNSMLNLEYTYNSLLRLFGNGFYNYVTDWILWTPTQSGIWTANNVKRVVSRGVNINIKIQNKVSMSDKGFVVAFYSGYSYTNTISLDAISINDNSQNKQLIYVPRHNFNASLQLQYRHYYIRTIHSFTGVRYTTTDNSQFLPGYYLTYLELGKDFYFNNQQIGLSFRISNITNCQYQVVDQRPMPGRSYEMTVRLNLTK